MLPMRWICGLSFIAAFVSNVFGGPLDWKISLQSGVDQYHLGHFAAAEDLLQAAVAGSREQGNVTQTADALNYLGDVYLSEERFAKADSAYTEALSLYKHSAGNEPGIAASLCNLGAVLSLEGFDHRAITVLNEALHQTKMNSGIDPRLRAEILNTLGIAYARQGNFKRAKALFQEVIRTQSETAAANFTTANAFNNLGYIHREEGKYADAQREYQRSIVIFENLLGPSHPELAIPHSSLGVLYGRMAHFEDAEDQLLVSLRIAQRTSPFIAGRVVRILHLLSDVYLHERKYTDAESVLARAAEIGRHSPDRDPENAVVLEAYAAMLKRSGKMEEARSAHLEADRMRATLALTVTVNHAQ